MISPRGYKLKGIKGTKTKSPSIITVQTTVINFAHTFLVDKYI